MDAAPLADDERVALTNEMLAMTGGLVVESATTKRKRAATERKAEKKRRVEEAQALAKRTIPSEVS